jgi:hypothetical protein
MPEDDIVLDPIDDPVDPIEPADDPIEPVDPIDPVKPAVDVVQLQATNKKLYERAKKAEADLKTLRSQKPGEANPTNVEETVLLANGMSEELLGELKAVAKVRNISLLKAQADPIFVAVKEKFEKDQKQKEASLPGSRGAGSVKAQKTFTSPGLSREEHRRMVLESR